jgi:RNA polymerase sigma factor (sigma-70 family)
VSSNPKSVGPDDNEFRALWDRNFGLVTSYVGRRVYPHRDRANDLVAEVFVVAWRRFDAVPPPPEDLPWLYGVARKVVASHFRSVQSRLRLVERIADDLRGGTDTSTSIDPRIERALEQLSEVDRELFRLICWEVLGQKEAGLVVGLTAKAVERRLQRARLKVRHQIAVSVVPASATTTASLPPYQVLNEERKVQ